MRATGYIVLLLNNHFGVFGTPSSALRVYCLFRLPVGGGHIVGQESNHLIVLFLSLSIMEIAKEECGNASLSEDV
jgi:hypothetical protein